MANSHDAATPDRAIPGQVTAPPAKILYCRCAYAKVIAPDVKDEVLQGLTRSGVIFEAVPDLCEMSARRDPRLKRLAAEDGIRIAACYPRAVKWLFSAAQAPLTEDTVEILNMRVDSAGSVVERLLEGCLKAEESS
ncbi:MAG: hypothetical protein OXU26_17320 [Acidobacteriota bacterium]|nr:hypothetical protein [Acidobacteriota bacterium]MDE2965671.1 hypothetical protein [Acidobacteriota bacterium]